MKNKKVTYILIPVVLVLWGSIIYKVYVYMYGDNPVNTGFPDTGSRMGKQDVIPDTFSIHPDYRDPFSVKTIAKATGGSSAIEKESSTQIKPKTTVNVSFPAVQYIGMIRNQESNKQLVMLSVNGQSTSIGMGMEFGGIQLLKVYKDSVEVRWGKERKFIKK